MSKQVIFSTALGILLLVGFVTYMWPGESAPVNYPPKQGVVIAFGDSLVAGVGSSHTEGFVGPLEELWGVEVLNRGVPGDTTEDGLSRLESDVLVEEPAIVLLLLGGNDFLRKKPREETFANLKHMIEVLQTEGTLVVLLGVQSGLFFDSDRNDFKELAQDTGAVYVPNVLDDIYGTSELMHDAIHPNEAGYHMIAEKIYDTLVDWDIAVSSL